MSVPPGNVYAGYSNQSGGIKENYIIVRLLGVIRTVGKVRHERKA